MMTQGNKENSEELFEYRSVHTGAVLGMVLGLVSVVLLFTASTSFERTLLMAPIPVIGFLISCVAWRSIASAPELYTGSPMAKAGAVLSALFLFVGVGYGSYVYSTEVPDGYARTSFLEMKPTEADKSNRKYIPDEIADYIKGGDKVFIKGYIRPDSTEYSTNFSEFLLVRDNQECCFGDLSKVQFFDQIKVKLGPGQTTDYDSGVFRLGGVLKLGPPDPKLGTPVTYHLDADYHCAPGGGF